MSHYKRTHHKRNYHHKNDNSDQNNHNEKANSDQNNCNENDNSDENNRKHYDCETEQEHVHEFLGSTKLAELQTDPHNHRFAGVTGEAIGDGECHVHKINTNTDFFDHFHEVIVTTGPAIDVGDNKHIHFVSGMTTEEDGHVHNFVFVTLIESPLV